MDGDCTTGNPKQQEDRQIKKEIGKLGDSMEYLSNKLTTLSARLMPALRIDPPKPPDEEQTVEVELVLFATDIRSIRYYVELKIVLIKDILDRSEI